jgi:hypothetical protein
MIDQYLVKFEELLIANPNIVAHGPITALDVLEIILLDRR